MNLFYLLGFGLIIHIIFLLSIFDIYFKSPIVKSILPSENYVRPPGKRVVLVSVDGLRLDAVHDVDPLTGKFTAGYMQNVIQQRGSWGVSHSRVPTESRPGHVALLAGFYEDPSAVTRGWKENPVDFDSIFNRSHCSFAWGSPDILKIFFKGLQHECAYMESYESEQNFAGDTKQYDNWVYDKLEKFMKFSHKSKTALNEEGIFFFLHLLGQDTSGHTDKPHSKKYRENLKNVDELLEKIETLFYSFYGDDRTTYIVTSDHGMTNWGSHGAGDLDETETPFIAWGAGIKKPADPITQFNISQADVTPLLAVLLGCSIPVNSVGTLPIAYLNMSRKQIAEAVELNARQMIAQYMKVLENLGENIISWFHIPFKKLPSSEVMNNIWFIRENIGKGKYSEAIREGQILIKTSLEGVNYYQNYYQKPLLLGISFSYLGWTAYLLLVLLQKEHARKACRMSFFSLNIGFGFSILMTSVLLMVQKLPVSFYCYMLLPQILWNCVLKKAYVVLPTVKFFDRKSISYICFSVVLGVEILVASFFKRWFLCIPIVGILIWSLKSTCQKKMNLTKVLWLTSGIALALFSLLPTVGTHPNPALIAYSGIGLMLLSFVVFNSANAVSFLIRFVALGISVWNSYTIHKYFNENHVLLAFNQYLSWLLLALSLCFIASGGSDILQRLAHIFMCLSVPFILLSVRHEGFFLIFLFVHLFCWILVEHSNKNKEFSHFRVGYFFLTYIFLSFFGLGNITSLNSFDPAWVRCFLTVFSPFLMCSLILFKTVIPFLVVTCTMRTLTVTSNIRPDKLFITVLMYCNIMGLNFLYLIKNKGSWLDIGISISHYVIQQVTIVFLVVLFGIAKLLMSPYNKDFNSGGNGRNIGKRMKDKSEILPIFVGSLKMHEF
ncbi:hypothetical protein RUM44_008616 [Polyplax serrata]|uniref:GPI ethanolamine phosphate transferase 1 n=1 Tax=Polyplax serrata TaxID=468196 RepID=A0ABR1BDN1_POLSC